jgi:DNA-binding XRE family transcriptional regulator
MNISGNQIKAARALAGIEQTELADTANVSVNTIRNMEATGVGTVAVRLDTLIRVRDALLLKGVRLLDDADSTSGGAGVRLVKHP